MVTIPAGFVEIGKIVGAHGIRGEVRVYPNSDFPERFAKKGAKRWLLKPNQTEPQSIVFNGGYFQDGKGLYILRLEGIDDRNVAEGLRNSLLLVPADDRPKLEKDEFLVADLIGLPVYEQATQTLVGTVSNMNTAGHDVLEIKQEGRDKPILVPFVMAIVPVVDLAAKRIEITPPPGLLDL
jgi:16S rRNA processing protein RimM